MRFIRILSIVAFLGWFPVSANAVLLNYTGNNFDTFVLSGPTTPTAVFTASDSVSFSLTLSASLAANLVGQFITPVSFTSSDGVNAISNLSATGSFFQFWTDSAGQITNWDVKAVIFAPTNGGGTSNSTTTKNQPGVSGAIQDFGKDELCGPASTTLGCVGFGNPFYIQLGEIRGSPGVWSYQTSPPGVPEPGVLSLLVIGLLGLAYRKKPIA